MKLPLKNSSYWKRWFFWMPITLFAALILAGTTGAFISELLHRWAEPIIGFVCAFTLVLTAYMLAPNKKIFTSILTFTGGALWAWFLLDTSSYPENYESAYQPTYIPIIITYIGGLLGLATVSFLEYRRTQPDGSANDHPRGAGAHG